MLALVFLCLPILSSAQTPSVPANQPFSVIADHDGRNTEVYRLYVDGIQVGSDVPVGTALSGTTVTLRHPGLSSRGSHSVAIAAVNGDNPEVRSASLAFDVKLPPPEAPSGVRLDVTVALRLNLTPDGTALVERLTVGVVPATTAP